MSTGIQGTSKYYCVFEPLGEGERLDYTADFTEELSDDDGNLVDSIATAVWTYEPEDGNLTLDGQGLLNNNTQALTFASTPKAGTLYRLVCTVTTPAGRTYEKALGIPSQKKDGTK